MFKVYYIYEEQVVNIGDIAFVSVVSVNIGINDAWLLAVSSIKQSSNRLELPFVWASYKQNPKRRKIESDCFFFIIPSPGLELVYL